MWSMISTFGIDRPYGVTMWNLKYEMDAIVSLYLNAFLHFFFFALWKLCKTFESCDNLNIRPLSCLRDALVFHSALHVWFKYWGWMNWLSQLRTSRKQKKVERFSYQPPGSSEYLHFPMHLMHVIVRNSSFLCILLIFRADDNGVWIFFDKPSCIRLWRSCTETRNYSVTIIKANKKRFSCTEMKTSPECASTKTYRGVHRFPSWSCLAE